MKEKSDFKASLPKNKEATGTADGFIASS